MSERSYNGAASRSFERNDATGRLNDGRTALVYLATALADIRYLDEILQNDVITHVNVNSGMIQHEKASNIIIYSLIIIALKEIVK